MVKKPTPKQLKDLTCTGTHSQVLKRLGHTSIQRILDDPVNFSAGDPYNYALVWNEDYGLFIYRWGHVLKTANFVLGSCLGHEEVFVGPAGRDRCIEKFLRMLKKGKSYHREYPDQYAERAEAPKRGKGKKK